MGSSAIEYLHKLSSDVKKIKWESDLKDVHIKALKEKISQYQEITDINASKLPKFGNSLKVFKADYAEHCVTLMKKNSDKVGK